MVQPQIDQLLAWAARDVNDIVDAKKEYFGATGGEVHEDDRCFEQRMQAFFNWYLLDRAKNGTTPVQRFLQEQGASLESRDKDVIMGLTQSRIGLYEYRGRRGFLRPPKQGQVRVRDIITSDDFNVTERRQMHGLEIGDIFEARLVPVGGTYHFSSSFTYHPRGMRRAILREVKRRKKQGQVAVRDLLWELERMQLQSERFKNVSIEAIYDFDKPFLGPRGRNRGEAA
ncbi:MAG: hypothetical protein ACJ79C_13040 [Myxococcales bacterium]